MLTEISTLDGYLERYGQLLAERTDKAFAPLHVPSRDKPIDVTLHRPMFEAQAHAVTAVVRGWERQKSMILCSDMGTGKTQMGIGAVHAHANGSPYRCLIMCPDHLCDKWAREVREVLGESGIVVRIIDDWKALIPLRKGAKPSSPQWWIIGRNKSKLGPKWRAAFVRKPADDAIYCPDCGQRIRKGELLAEPKDLERTRMRCQVNIERRTATGWEVSTCNAHLWQDTGELKRIAPAGYIHKRLKGFFQYLLADEIHESKGAETSQGMANGSLAASCNKVLALTGTLIGGYANHILPILFRLSPKSLIAEGFTWGNSIAFLKQYGRIETTITERTGRNGESEDNRMSRGSKPTKRENPRPGIMPTLYGRHLMGNTVFLGLEEVAAGLPQLDEITVPVTLDAPLMSAYKDVESALADAMRDMIRRGDKRLLGTMLQALLAYPDYPFNWNTIGYWDKPKGCAEGTFIPVVTPENFSMQAEYAKEERLLEILRAEKAAGRQCWVFVQYTDKRPVAGRLEEMLRKHHFKTTHLKSSVPLRTREKWIHDNAPDLDVVISHPKLVETGLDLFCKKGRFNFPTLIFYETGYNLFTLRQASRRAWRIAQRQRCKVYYLYYEATMQERAMTLMGKKLTASLALEGKFSSDGLAAMAGEDGTVEMELAKSLSERISFSAERQWARLGAGIDEQPVVPDEVDAEFFDDDLFSLRDVFGDADGDDPFNLSSLFDESDDLAAVFAA